MSWISCRTSLPVFSRSPRLSTGISPEDPHRSDRISFPEPLSRHTAFPCLWLSSYRPESCRSEIPSPGQSPRQASCGHMSTCSSPGCRMSGNAPDRRTPAYRHFRKTPSSAPRRSDSSCASVSAAPAQAARRWRDGPPWKAWTNTSSRVRPMEQVPISSASGCRRQAFPRRERTHWTAPLSPCLSSCTSCQFLRFLNTSGGTTASFPGVSPVKPCI